MSVVRGFCDLYLFLVSTYSFCHVAAGNILSIIKNRQFCEKNENNILAELEIIHQNLKSFLILRTFGVFVGLIF